jgi:hypothetical protein
VRGGRRRPGRRGGRGDEVVLVREELPQPVRQVGMPLQQPDKKTQKA